MSFQNVVGDHKECQEEFGIKYAGGQTMQGGILAGDATWGIRTYVTCNNNGDIRSDDTRNISGNIGWGIIAESCREL